MLTRGTVALVTGASGGIGSAVAERLHRSGARLVLHGRGGDCLDALADRYGAEALALDLAEPDAGRRLGGKALAVHGRLDVVVHAAGIGAYGPFAAIDEDRLERLVEVNVRAPVQLTREVLPHMIAAGRGHVAFVGSIAGLTGVAQEAAYSATKFAITGLAESLALELSGTGVGVSLVSPGAVDTNFCAARGVAYGRRTPRPVSPGRVADLVLRGITGDGGRHVVPRWLALGPAVRALAPPAYVTLARRFG